MHPSVAMATVANAISLSMVQRRHNLGKQPRGTMGNEPPWFPGTSAAEACSSEGFTFTGFCWVCDSAPCRCKPTATATLSSSSSITAVPATGQLTSLQKRYFRPTNFNEGVSFRPTNFNEGARTDGSTNVSTDGSTNGANSRGSTDQRPRRKFKRSVTDEYGPEFAAECAEFGKHLKELKKRRKTEAPTEAPTEAKTEAPTEAPTEAQTEAHKEDPTVAFEDPDDSKKAANFFEARDKAKLLREALIQFGNSI